MSTLNKYLISPVVYRATILQQSMGEWCPVDSLDQWGVVNSINLRVIIELHYCSFPLPSDSHGLVGAAASALILDEGDMKQTQPSWETHKHEWEINCCCSKSLGFGVICYWGRTVSSADQCKCLPGNVFLVGNTAENRPMGTCGLEDTVRLPLSPTQHPLGKIGGNWV